MNNIFQIIAQKKYGDDLSPGLYTYLNHYSYLLARKRKDLFLEFDAIGFDGVFLSTIMKFLGLNSERKSFDMTSVAHKVFTDAESHGKEIIFVGGEIGVSQAAAQEVRKSFPNVKIIECYPGFFSSMDERLRVIRDIVKARPHVVICGMGTVYQESFLLDLSSEGWSGSGYTCGGFFHQTASKGIKYYPDWANRLNLRWLFRMYDEPKIARRYTLDVLRFSVLFFIDFLRFKINYR